MARNIFKGLDRLVEGYHTEEGIRKPKKQIKEAKTRTEIRLGDKVYPIKDREFLKGKVAGYGNEQGLEHVRTIKYPDGTSYKIYDSGFGNFGHADSCAVLDEKLKGDVPPRGYEKPTSIKGDWIWDEVRYDWYDSKTGAYYAEVKDTISEGINEEDNSKLTPYWAIIKNRSFFDEFDSEKKALEYLDVLVEENPNDSFRLFKIKRDEDSNIIGRREEVILIDSSAEDLWPEIHTMSQEETADAFGKDIYDIATKKMVKFSDLDEALYGKKEIDEFFLLCDELGLKTFGDLQDFADTNRNRISVNKLLSDHGLTLSADAFFETLRDRVAEKDEFKYDDPLNVIKNKKIKNSHLKENSNEISLFEVIYYDLLRFEKYFYEYGDEQDALDSVGTKSVIYRAKSKEEAKKRFFSEHKITEWEIYEINQLQFDNKNKNESLDNNENTKNSIEVEVKSGINGDGFKVIVKDVDGSIIEQEDFSYGYNASYNKSWADKDKPFVTDIINSYLSKYNLSKDDLILTKGKNVFKDKDVSGETITRFRTDYLSESKKGHVEENFLSEAISSKDISEYCDTPLQEDTLKLINRIAKREGVSLRIGTRVGKYPQSLIIDNKYQDNAIRIYPNGACSINDKRFGDWQLGYGHINIEEFKKGITSAIKEMSPLKESKSVKLTEGHEQYDYKGFSIDLDDDQFHNIKRHGSGNITVEIKIGDKVYATVNGYDAAEEWIDKNGQKILDEITAKNRKEEERNALIDACVKRVQTSATGEHYATFGNDSGEAAVDVSLSKEDILKAAKIGSGGVYTNGKGRSIPLSMINGFELYLNWDITIPNDPYLGVGLYANAVNENDMFKLLGDPALIGWYNIHFIPESSEEVKEFWKTEILPKANNIAHEIVENSWRNSKYSNYDGIYEALVQEDSIKIKDIFSVKEIQKDDEQTWADKEYADLMKKGKPNWDESDWETYHYVQQLRFDSGYYSEGLKEEYGPYKDNEIIRAIGDQIADGNDYGNAYDRDWELKIYAEGGEVIENENISSDFYSRLLTDISYPVLDGHLNYYGLNIILYGVPATKEELEFLGFTDEDTERYLRAEDFEEEIETWIDYEITYDGSDIEDEFDSDEDLGDDILDDSKKGSVLSKDIVEEVRSEILSGLDIPDEWFSYPEYLVDDGSGYEFYTVKVIDGDLARQIELFINSNYDGVSLVAFDAETNELLDTYGGSQELNISIFVNNNKFKDLGA